MELFFIKKIAMSTLPELEVLLDSKVICSLTKNQEALHPHLI
jgi:hypothetical protein